MTIFNRCGNTKSCHTIAVDLLEYKLNDFFYKGSKNYGKTINYNGKIRKQDIREQTSYCKKIDCFAQIYQQD